MIDIGDVKAAATRISKYIRRTPLLRADQCAAPASDADLWLKLECLQPTGSFKVRGATNKLLTTPRAELERGIVTASGGNHGLAVARAARLAGVKAIVFAPTTVTSEKVDKIRKWGAETRTVGALWTSQTAKRSHSQSARVPSISIPSPIRPSSPPGHGWPRDPRATARRRNDPCCHWRRRAHFGPCHGGQGDETGHPHRRHRASRLADPERIARRGTCGPPCRGHDPYRHHGLRQDR
jgi:hypothetical protein